MYIQIRALITKPKDDNAKANDWKLGTIIICIIPRNLIFGIQSSLILAHACTSYRPIHLRVDGKTFA